MSSFLYTNAGLGYLTPRLFPDNTAEDFQFMLITALSELPGGTRVHNLFFNAVQLYDILGFEHTHKRTCMHTGRIIPVFFVDKLGRRYVRC